MKEDKGCKTEVTFIKPKLYPFEIEVLYWAAEGKTSDETAIILGLSAHTFNAHRREAIRKLHANNITHAVFKAVSWGIILINSTLDPTSTPFSL